MKKIILLFILICLIFNCGLDDKKRVMTRKEVMDAVDECKKRNFKAIYRGYSNYEIIDVVCFSEDEYKRLFKIDKK